MARTGAIISASRQSSIRLERSISRRKRSDMVAPGADRNQVGIHEDQRIVAAIGQRNAPIPAVLARLDPRHRTASLCRANSHRAPAWTRRFWFDGCGAMLRRPLASATKSASEHVRSAVGVDGQAPFRAVPVSVRGRARADGPAPRRLARAPAGANQTRRGRPAGPFHPRPRAASVHPPI